MGDKFAVEKLDLSLWSNRPWSIMVLRSLTQEDMIYHGELQSKYGREKFE